MSKLPDMYDWINKGVLVLNTRKKEQQHKILRDMFLPCLKVKVLQGKKFNFSSFKEEVIDFLRQTSPVVFISSPNKPELPKDWISDVTQWEKINDFVKKYPNYEDYNFLITEMVTPTEDSLTGIAVSDGNENILMEFSKKPNCVNISPIASGCSKIKYQDLAHVKDGNIRIKPKKVRIEDVKKIFEHLKNKKGYFEFIKGLKNERHGIFFMDFQDDPAYTKALEMADYIDENPF